MTAEGAVELGAWPGFRMPPLGDLRGDLAAVALEPERLRTVYVDTDELRLARWGACLRHRSGEGWRVVLPLAGAGELLPQRGFSLPGDDPASPPDEAVDLLRAYVRSAPLRPAAQLRTVRRRIELRDGTGVRLADVLDDEVSLLSGRRIAARFRELSIDPSDGIWPGLLDDVVARLRSAGAGDPDPMPEQARAVGPAGAEPPEVVPGKIGSGASAGDVVRRAIAVSVIRLLGSDAVMRLDADPEGVHRGRVATRRLRSDLRTFASLLDPGWTQALRDELRWLGRVLGEARDADVMHDRIRSPLPSPVDENTGIAAVVDALAQRRKEAHAALLETLASPRYVALLDRLVEDARDPALLSEADLPATATVSSLVRSPWRKLRRAVEDAGPEPSDAQLHAIRIQAKWVRYGAEAVAPLVGKPARRFAERAAQLQDVLGEHHDAVVAEAWLRGWAGGRSDPDAAFAAGMLAAAERAAAGDARGRWHREWKRVAKAQSSSGL
jgi:CHAD domain-containing protein